jgi:hypothetical protein
MENVDEFYKNINAVDYEVILTTKGWQGRRNPAGRERTALLTAPCETPEQAEEALRRALRR